MSQRSFLKVLVVMLLAAVLAAGFYYQWRTSTSSAQDGGAWQLNTGSVLPQAKNIAAFHLTDINHHAFTNKNLAGHWSLLFFGFTRCPQLCPTTMARLNQVWLQLKQQGDLAMPQVVFISVDTDRDTLAQIKSYVHGFNTHFTGATGSAQAIQALTKQMNVVYAKVNEGDDQQNYTINHSGTIIVVNPQGRVAAFLTHPDATANVVADYEAILKHQT